MHERLRLNIHSIAWHCLTRAATQGRGPSSQNNTKGGRHSDRDEDWDADEAECLLRDCKARGFTYSISPSGIKLVTWAFPFPTRIGHSRQGESHLGGPGSEGDPRYLFRFPDRPRQNVFLTNLTFWIHLHRDKWGSRPCPRPHPRSYSEVCVQVE